MTKSDDRRRYPCCGVERGTTHKLSCPHNSHRMPPPQRRATFDPPDMDDEPVLMGEHNRLPPERYSPKLCGVCQRPTDRHRSQCPHGPHEPVYVAVDPAKPDSDESITFITEGHMITPVMTLQPQPINIAFNDDNGREVGKFEYDKDLKRWTFEGNMDAAAKQFAKFMFAHFQSIIEGDRDKLLDDAITDMYGGKVDEHEPEPETVWPEKTPMPGSDKTFKQIYEGKF